MSYQVELRPRAQRVADRLWRTSPNPLSIQSSIDRMIAKLSHDPNGAGVRFDPAHMALWEHPLAAVYRIDEARKIVQIVELWPLDEAERNQGFPPPASLRGLVFVPRLLHVALLLGGLGQV